jgi:hypothetical protein
MGKKEDSGWFKKDIGLIPLIIVFAIIMSWLSDDEPKVKKQPSTAYSAKLDKWWEDTDKYAICYGNVTAAHKANGFHERNRKKSVQIKQELCKIAATSTTGEGCAWLNNCEY